MIGFYIGLLVYNLLGATVLSLGWPYLAFKCLSGDRKWLQRCGGVIRHRGASLWIHAASIGEVSMLRPLMIHLERLFSDQAICLSTMTTTGQRKAREFVSHRAQTFFFPLDFIPIQLRALSCLRPRLVILSETELWPNLIWLCRLRGIPVFLVNARISSKSFPYYNICRFLFGPLIRSLSLVACQTEIDFKRYAALAGGEMNLVLAGNMKYDVIAKPPSLGEKASARRALGLRPDEVVMVAGSTREGEEEIIFEAWQEVGQRFRVEDSKSGSRFRSLKLIIAPRHQTRFQKVADMMRERGWNFARRSAGEGFSAQRPILLWDTVGELISAYAVGDIAFVGGSLVPVGGHNPLEPAALGLPVVFGPYMDNAAESAKLLIEAGGAVQIASAAELAEVILAWIIEENKRRMIGISARRMVESRQGAARRTAEMIAQILYGQAPSQMGSMLAISGRRARS